MKDKLKKNIRRIRGNKDATVLLSNFGYLTALQIGGYIFPIITIPYLARVIGVDSFGKIAFASAIIVWFDTITGWGFNFTATRDVAINRNDKDKISEIFSNVIWAKSLLMILCFIVLLILSLLVPMFRENQTIILITFLTIPGHIMFPDWFFQAMERMKYITILNILSKLVFTIAVFVFIKEKSDYILQPLFISLGLIVSGIFAMYFILIRWKIKLKRPILSDILKTIKGSTNVFINNVAPNFYNSFSTLLLGFYGGTISTGILSAGSKFTALSQQFMDIIARVFFPFLSRKIDKHGMYAKLNIYLSLAITFLLFTLAPFIIRVFYTVEFYDAIIVLRVLSLSVFLISVRSVYGTHYMILQGYEKQLRNITITGSLIGFIISFPLIYYFDFIGAALTIIVSLAIMAFLTMKKGMEIKKHKKISLNY